MSKLQATEPLKQKLSRFPKIYDALRLPYALARFKMRIPHDRDYRAFSLFPEKTGLFLDIGANAGQSAMSFRIYRTNEIRSIEANPFHRQDLRFTGRVVENFRFHIYGASDEEEFLRLYVPVFRGVPITPEATLDSQSLHKSESLLKRIGGRKNWTSVSIREQIVEVGPVDVLGLKPDFIKLDIQGHEYKALCGLQGTLEQSSPVLMVETPDSKTKQLLAQYNYMEMAYEQDRHRFSWSVDDCKNLFFARQEDVRPSIFT